MGRPHGEGPVDGTLALDSTMESAAIDHAMKAFYLVPMLSMPPIVVASLIGILLNLAQAITQLQEQTLTFGVRLLAVVSTLFIMGGWLSGGILRYAGDISSRFHMIC